MTSNAFLISGHNELVELHRSPYESEDLLQRLLADHPSLLRQIGGSGGRLLLIQREVSVGDAEGSGGRWSLDHLFVDSDGVPVLIEVKRASDTRLRREVVGQMMDYAANGVAYWPIDALVDAHAGTALAAGEDAETSIAAFASMEAEAFWRQVEANLRSGRVRLVFVADVIPRELRRIVEFLNEQMRPAEVLALEIDQYVTSDGQRMLMPRIVGKTERAISAKSLSPQGPALTVEEWISSLHEKWGHDGVTVAQNLVDWAKAQGLEVGVTDSRDAISMSVPQPGGKSVWPFFIRRSSGKLETSLQYLQYASVYASEPQRQALLNEFKSIPTISITTTKTTGWPSVRLIDIQRPEVWTAWKRIGEGILGALRNNPTND